MPHGFYLVLPELNVQRGDLVVFYLPRAVMRQMRGRNWLSHVQLLIKKVAAVEGDSVCNREGKLTINDSFVAIAQKEDGEGRAIPTFRGCFQVGSEYFLPLSSHIPNSFDGRYFGAVSKDDLLGRAVPLLIWD